MIMIKIWFKYSLLIFFAIIINACSGNNTKNTNQNFIKEYGGDLIDIKRKIQDNNSNAAKIIAGQYNTINSLNFKATRYGDYDRKSKIYFPSYLDYNMPDQYPIKIVNFNDIKIPTQDLFYVKTRMEKSYPLVDYNYLQSNIRQINKGKK